MVDRIQRKRVAPAHSHESSITVTSSSYGVEERERKTLKVHKFETEPAYVRVNAGSTKNLGNYESLRLDVSITVPCYVEEVDAVFERVADDVAARLADELEKYES